MNCPSLFISATSIHCHPGVQGEQRIPLRDVKEIRDLSGPRDVVFLATKANDVMEAGQAGDYFRRRVCWLLRESTLKHAAILSADVRGYSRLMNQDEEATVKILALSDFAATSGPRRDQRDGAYEART